MKKITLLTVLVFLLCSALSVYGGGKQEKTASSGDDLTIKVFSTWSPTDSNIGAVTANKVLAQFKAAHPEVKLVEEVVAHDLYEDKLKVLMATDELPDVFQSLPGLMPAMYADKQILDLRPIVEADRDWSGRMLEGAFADFTFNDRYLALPGSMLVSSMIVYNKAIFEAAGIREFPKTMEDFEKAVIAIKAAGYIPVACGNKAGYMITSQVFPSIMWRYIDTAWYQSLKDGRGAKFTDPQMVAAITELKKLTDLGVFNDDLNSSEELLANGYYYSGKAAMLIGGYWIVPNVDENAIPEVLNNSEVAMLPPLAASPQYGKYMSGGQGWGTVFSSKLTGRRLELAMELAKGFADPRIQAELATGGSIPCAKPAAYDTSGMSPLKKKMYAMFENYDLVPNTEIQFNATYVSAAEKGYQELTLGLISPAELAARLQTAYVEGQTN
jgi:raffinose/stachyose/melibiose transport system substrate-binding protein